MLKITRAGSKALALILVLLLVCSGCGAAGVQLPTLTLDTDESGAVVREKPDASGFEDSLEGLMAYMEKGKAVVRSVETGTVEQAIASGDPAVVQMSYKEIGATDGYRYQFTFERGSVLVEFYRFDPENLNEKAQDCLGSVRETGSFRMLDNEVPAVLHSSGRYMMIYTDPRAEKEAACVDQKKWTEELFASFPAE